MLEEKYFEFLIKGYVKEGTPSENFTNYIFGYEENISHNDIFETKFFKNDYENSDLDRLFPLSSIPKNGENLKNTYFENNEFQVHSYIEDGSHRILDLLEVFSTILEQDEEIYCLYYSNDEIIAKILKVSSSIIEEITIDEEEKYKNIINKHFS